MARQPGSLKVGDAEGEEVLGYSRGGGGACMCV